MRQQIVDIILPHDIHRREELALDDIAHGGVEIARPDARLKALRLIEDAVIKAGDKEFIRKPVFLRLLNDRIHKVELAALLRLEAQY